MIRNNQKSPNPAGCLFFLAIPVGVLLGLISLFVLHGPTRFIVMAGCLAMSVAGFYLGKSFFRQIVAFQGKQDEAFWIWFQENEAEFRSLSPNDFVGQGEAIQQICAELVKARSQMTAEMCIRPGEKAELVISAGGDAHWFPHVEDFIKTASPLEHWNIVCLKPRKGGAKMILNGQEFTAESIFYKLDEPQKDGRLPITFYFTGFVEGDPNSKSLYGQVAFIYLDALLGERDTAEGIGELHFQPMEDRPEQSWPLTELAKHFDELRAHYAKLKANTVNSGTDKSTDA